MEIATLKGNPLADARAEAGYTTLGLAAASSVGKSTIIRIEAGKSIPTAPAALALAAALYPGRPLDELRTLADKLRGDLQRWQEQHEGESSSDE